jgi:hypothetical protein
MAGEGTYSAATDIFRVGAACRRCLLALVAALAAIFEPLLAAFADGDIAPTARVRIEPTLFQPGEEGVPGLGSGAYTDTDVGDTLTPKIVAREQEQSDAPPSPLALLLRPLAVPRAPLRCRLGRWLPRLKERA